MGFFTLLPLVDTFTPLPLLAYVVCARSILHTIYEITVNINYFFIDWGFRLSDTNTTQVGKMLITKAIGYMSDEVENDYEHITDNYKAREGTLNERLIYMKAMRQANLNMNNRYPGMKNNDVYFQMIDLDKGVFGHAFLVSLFIHVSILFERNKLDSSNLDIYIS